MATKWLRSRSSRTRVSCQRHDSRRKRKRHRSLAGTWCLPQNVPHAAAWRTVNELQLLGYTADYGFLVFSSPDDESVRFRVQVDADLVETLREITQRQNAPPAAAEPAAPEPKAAAPRRRSSKRTVAAKKAPRPRAATSKPRAAVSKPRETAPNPRPAV